MDIKKLNEIAWDNEVKLGNKWTLPLTTDEVILAKKGVYKLFLTPNKEVPKEWIGNVKDKKVLCLASEGGQQDPIFAALEADVIVFDNSKEQLFKDQEVSKRDNLKITLEYGDMRDLSRFDDKSFDFSSSLLTILKWFGRNVIEF